MISELVRSRELIWRLFIRDFSVRYKQTVLGVLWAVIMPLVLVGAFVLLNRSGVLNIGELEVPYAAYALLGLTVWQVFAGGLTATSNSIVSSGSMVVKINFPKETLVIASFGQTLVELLVRLALVVVVFIYYRLVPHWAAVFFPLALVPLLLFTLGLGFLLSLLNALLRDVANIITLATMFLLFLTPVLYPEPQSAVFQALTRVNPLAALVAVPRDLVLGSSISNPAAFSVASALSLAVFILGWRVFHLAESRMVERIGAQ
jgi:lipopolysaccharide transport system permease protein